MEVIITSLLWQWKDYHDYCSGSGHYDIFGCGDGFSSISCGPHPLLCLGNCSEYQFQCRNGQCIDATLACNRVIDCADGSDESGCLCELGTGVGHGQKTGGVAWSEDRGCGTVRRQGVGHSQKTGGETGHVQVIKSLQNLNNVTLKHRALFMISFGSHSLDT